MDKYNSTDTSATAQRAVASGPLVRCVFHVRNRRALGGIASDDNYECGCRAVAEYYEPIYRAWRPICARHRAVIIGRGKATIRTLSPNGASET